MSITLHPTTLFTSSNGVLLRVWEGKTEEGHPVLALIHRVASAEETGQQELQKSLLEVQAPSVQGAWLINQLGG